MAAQFSVYGFAHTKPIVLPHATLWPMLDATNESHELARSKSSYFLTSVGVADDSYSGPQLEQLLFDLQAVLTFCQQQHVIIPEVKATQTNSRPSTSLPGFSNQLPNYGGSRGSGLLIGDDRLFANSRADFVRICMLRLEDDQFCSSTGFRQALFYAIHAIQAQRRYVQIDYYLHFSALEMLARQTTKDTKSSASQVIGGFLKNTCGLSVVIDNGASAERSVTNYCRLRNSIYHEGKLSCTYSDGIKTATIGVETYLDPLRSLLQLALLKTVGFDDGHVNWNQWIDRIPFN